MRFARLFFIDTYFFLVQLFVQGERLSHAVGCAFTACLQRKQKQIALKEQHLEVSSSFEQVLVGMN